MDTLFTFVLWWALCFVVLVGKGLFDLIGCCFAGVSLMFFSLCWLMWLGVRLRFRFVCWGLVLKLVIYCVIRCWFADCCCFSICYLRFVCGFVCYLVWLLMWIVLFWCDYFASCVVNFVVLSLISGWVSVVVYLDLLYDCVCFRVVAWIVGCLIKFCSG